MKAKVSGNFTHIDEKTLYWLVGLLEGEGSVLAPSSSSPNKPGVAFTATDVDVISKVSELLNGM